MKTIGVVGSRRRDDLKDLRIVSDAFHAVYKHGDRIVSGHCPKGGDRFAEILAAEVKATEANGQLILHRPEWHKYGRAAGLKRNTFIAQDATVLIACVAADRTGGTEDTIKKFMRFHPHGQLVIV